MEAHLCEGHLGYDGQHNLLSLGGVGILLMLLEPGLQSAGGLPGGRLGPGRVTIRVLTVWVEPLGGVDRQSVGSGILLRALCLRGDNGGFSIFLSFKSQNHSK